MVPGGDEVGWGGSQLRRLHFDIALGRTSATVNPRARFFADRGDEKGTR